MSFVLKKLLLLVVPCTLSGVLSSCSSYGLKAPKPQPSAFLKDASLLKPETKHGPFALSSGSARAPELKLGEKRHLYIAPVTIEYLKPASRMLSKFASKESTRQRAAQKLADYTREKCIKAFATSKDPQYVLDSEPSKDGLTLQLAITQLNRPTPVGVVTRFTMDSLVIPGTDLILSKITRPLRGNITMEGKLIENRKHKLLYQFADNEESKTVLIFPLMDFTANGQARRAIREWAKQFEKLTRAKEGERVFDSIIFSLF